MKPDINSILTTFFADCNQAAASSLDNRIDVFIELVILQIANWQAGLVRRCCVVNADTDDNVSSIAPCAGCVQRIPRTLTREKWVKRKQETLRGSA